MSKMVIRSQFVQGSALFFQIAAKLNKFLIISCYSISPEARYVSLTAMTVKNGLMQ